MSDIYIRNIDASVKAKLKAEAKRKGISNNELVKMVLEDYVRTPTTRNVEDKYINLAKDITSAFLQECKKNQECIEELSYEIKNMVR